MSALPTNGPNPMFDYVDYNAMFPSMQMQVDERSQYAQNTMSAPSGFFTGNTPNPSEGVNNIPQELGRMGYTPSVSSYSSSPSSPSEGFNYLQFGSNLLDMAGGYYLGKEGSEQAMEIGQQGFDQSQLLGQDAASMAQFKPFTVATGLGEVSATPEGGFNLTLDPRQSAIQEGAFDSGYDYMMGAGQDPLSQLMNKRAYEAFKNLGPSSLTTAGQGAFQTLTPSQLALMGEDAMAGFSPDALTTQGARAVQGASPSALTGQGVSDYMGLTPSDLKNLGIENFTGLSQDALTRLGAGGLGAVGGDPMQREILAQARERFQNIGTDPRQQNLLSRADTAFGQAFGDSSQAQADIYSQLRAVQQPEEERERLALEERMLAQGRLGVSSSAYGGSSPELLAQAKALEEARASASLTARQQANKEQQQAYDRGLGLLGEASGMRAQELEEATGLLGAGYTPEQRELARARAQMEGGLSREQAELERAEARFTSGLSEEEANRAMARERLEAGLSTDKADLNRYLSQLESGMALDKSSFDRASTMFESGLSREEIDLMRADTMFGAGLDTDKFNLRKATDLLESSYVPRTQDLSMAETLFGIGYTPEKQMLEAYGYGLDGAKIRDIGARTGAELYTQAGQSGIEALMQGMSEASAYDLAMKRGLLDTTSGMLSGGFDSNLSADSWSDMNDFERAMVLKDYYDKYKNIKANSGSNN